MKTFVFLGCTIVELCFFWFHYDGVPGGTDKKDAPIVKCATFFGQMKRSKRKKKEEEWRGGGKVEGKEERRRKR